MHRRPKFWVKALGLGLVLLCLGISCERELGDSIEPVSNWRQHFLQDGDRGVDIRSILYVELHDSLNPDSANSNTVKLFQASGSALLAGAIVTGDGAEVPGRISVFNLESGKGAYLAFEPRCDLYPLTDYRLELLGLLLADGSPMPDLILHFTTGPLPRDYLDPFYCDELVLPLMAYDLSDLLGINGGLAGDTACNLVAVGILSDPPLYQRIADNSYSFGYLYKDTDLHENIYYWTDSDYLFLPPPTPYTVLVYITNRSPSADLSLGLTPGYFNVRPYWPTVLLDSFTTVDAWTSSDPTNTPVFLESGEYSEGFSGMRIHLNLPNSLDDSISRPWSGGFPADTTGIMFAFKMGNVTSGGASYSRLELQLRDSDGNVVGSNIEIAGVNTNWIFFTRALPEDFDPLVTVTTFDPTKVDQISLVIVNNPPPDPDPPPHGGNDLVGDLFVDFLTIGDMPNLAVYYPPEVITPQETLPLYVDQDGSTYWAYDNNGLHILNLVGEDCAVNCPLLDPGTALTPSNLAQEAP